MANGGSLRRRAGIPVGDALRGTLHIRWSDPATIWLAAIAFAAVCGARFVADGARTTLPAAALNALIFAVCCYLVGVLLCSWFDAAAIPVQRPDGVSRQRSNDVVGEQGRSADETRQSPLQTPARDHMLICSWLHAGERFSVRKSLRQRFFIYWFVLLVCWAPWVAFCWPGVMRDDTIAQFMQSSGYHRYFTQHPLFDTLVFGLFWRLGGLLGNQVWGLACYIILQTLVMAANLALVLCYLRSRGVPPLAVGFGLLYSATFYAVVGAVPTMSKDSFSALFMVPLAVLVVEIAMTRGEMLKHTWVCVALVTLMTLAMISKRTVLVILFCVFVALAFAASKARLRVVCCFLIAAVLAQGVWTPLVNTFTNADVSVDRDVFGFVMLPVARIASEDINEITPQERAELAPVMDVEMAAGQYNHLRSDETSWTMNIKATTTQKLTAMQAWIQLAFRHPRAFLKAYATLDYGWYYPSGGIAFPASSEYIFSPGYMHQWNTFVAPPVTAEFVLRDFTEGLRPLPQWKANVVETINNTVESPVFSYAVYLTYVPVLMGLYFMSRRRWRHLAAWSMLGFTVLSLYFSPIVMCWFAVPAFDMLPLMVGLGFVRANESNIEISQ